MKTRSLLKNSLSVQVDFAKSPLSPVVSPIQSALSSLSSLSMQRSFYNSIDGEEVSTLSPLVVIKGETGSYEILPTITLSLAAELEEQTGLAVVFKLGQSTAKFIGSGNGNAYDLQLGRHQKTGQYVGIKQTNGAKKIALFPDETVIQSRLSGLPHLMLLTDSILEKKLDRLVLYQIMPLTPMENGKQLANYLSNIHDKPFKQEILWHAAKSILTGLDAMHQKRIAHNHFKPDNFVINRDNDVFVRDFCCATPVDEKARAIGLLNGDSRYFSPERFAAYKEESHDFDAKANDAWSVGLTLLELNVGIIPNKEDWNREDVNLHPFLQEVKAGSYAALVKGLLTVDPAKRLTLSEALGYSALATYPTSSVWLVHFRQSLQTLQWQNRLYYPTEEPQVLTSAQQLPLPHFPAYINRPELEEAIITALLDDKSDSAITACVGVIGKTELFTYLVHEAAIQEHFSRIFLFRAADDADQLQLQYQGFAQELGLIDAKTTWKVTLSLVLSWFESQATPWLIIFDHADAPHILREFLPQKGGKILVSSLSNDWGKANKVEVNTLTPETVFTLLQKSLPEQREKITVDEANRLGEMIGYFPLAFTQAIALIHQEKWSISDYLKKHAMEQVQLLQSDSLLLDKKLPASLVTLYAMQFKRLEAAYPVALELLFYSTLIAPNAMPLALFHRTLKTSYEIKDAAIQALLKYGIWQKDQDSNTVHIHPLVQQVVRRGWTEEEWVKHFNIIVKETTDYYWLKENVLMRSYSDLPAGHIIEKEEKRQKNLQPHLKALLDIGDSREVLLNTIPMANLLSCRGIFYHKSGDYHAAKASYERALVLQETYYGKGHVELAKTLMNLGNACYALRKVQTAKKMYERALMLQDAYDERDPVQLPKILINLGNAYYVLREVNIAKEMYEQALRLQEAHYGKEHVALAITLSNLGNTYYSLGMVMTAKEYYEQVLALEKTHYGKDHVALAPTFECLGNAYYALREVEIAKVMYERALKLKESHYGKENGILAKTLVNLGNACQDLGEVEIAKKMYERALPLYEEHYGKEHEESKDCRKILLDFGNKQPFSTPSTR
jgi:tetratricopeptide (TPR) repeat protein/serine/threonine protein kinase